MDSLHHSWVSIIAMQRKKPQLRTELVVQNFREPRNKPLKLEELVTALDSVPGLQQARQRNRQRSQSAPVVPHPSPTIPRQMISPMKTAMNQFSAETKFTSSRTNRSGPGDTGEAYFRSLRNPLDPLGGGIPDQTVAPLERIVVKSEYPITAGDGGSDTLHILYPGCANAVCILNNTTADGNLAQSALSNCDNYSAISTIFDEYRPVAMRAYVAPTQALTAATGEVTMGTINVPTAGFVGVAPSAVRPQFSDRESRLFASMSGRQYALWSPEDSSESALQLVTAIALTNGGAASSRNGQCLAVLIQGCTTGTATPTSLGHVCVETVFEMTPQSAYAFLGRATRHRCDPIGQATALNGHYGLGPLVGF